MTDRERAFLLLQRVELFGSPASSLLVRESSFVREVVRGVLRWRLRLDYLTSRLSRRSAQKIDHPALQILRIAIYELMFMDAPAYAPVNEAVDLAARHTRRARGFVNAVLRKASNTNLQSILPSRNAPDRLAVEYSHPQWLFEKWVRFFGPERAVAIAAANQEHSRADLLVRSMEQAEEILRSKDLAFLPSPLAERMVRLSGSSASLRDEIQAGVFHPMDEGSAVVASLVSQEDVLDLAAAPGGKSLYLTLAGHRVVSHDRSVARLRLLGGAFRRFGYAKHSIVAGDGIHPPFKRRFDSVLLDAPCSGTGTIRKHPEIKWRLDGDCFLRYSKLQRDLLHAALDLADHECIYSTCSLEPEENDEVVEQVLRNHLDFAIADVSSRLNESARQWVDEKILRLTPESGADGFTAFVLRRR